MNTNIEEEEVQKLTSGKVQLTRYKVIAGWPLCQIYNFRDKNANANERRNTNIEEEKYK